MILEISDNDGFLALVNNEKYNSFYKEDWELKGLFNHFVEEMNRSNLIIWRTGYEGGDYKVEFNELESDKISFREFEAIIEITNGKLFLSEYGALTMAASYDSSKIPANHHSKLFIPLPNGKYSLKIKQLFEPDSFEFKYETQFEIVIKNHSKSNEDKKESIFWNQ
jgi:hypothetical protein